MTVIAHILAPANFGGLERVVSGLALATAQRGHTVVLVIVLEPGRQPPEWASALRDRGLTIETLNVGTRAYLTERRETLRILKRHSAQVVHTHGYRSDVVGGLAARAAGYPIISTAHGFVRGGWRGRLYVAVQLLALRRFDAVVAVSGPLRSEMLASGIDANRLALIVNGLVESVAPVRERKDARRLLSLPADGPVIGWVGRLSYEKGPDVMLQAFARTNTAGATLCLIGDGPLRDELQKMATDLGIASRVRFAGALPNAETMLTAFDLLALSSRTEGTPMVLLEAGPARVPIVATAVGGVPLLLGQDGARLVPAADPVALARALDETLGDPRGARARAEAFALALSNREKVDDWVGRYEQIYERLSAAARKVSR